MDFGAKRYRYYSDVWKTSSRPAILLLLGMVFLGWLIIWILIPTNTFYEIWLPKLHAQTDSTYFGTQGYNSLSFSLRKLYFQLIKRIFIVISTWAGVKLFLSYIYCSRYKPLVIHGPHPTHCFCQLFISTFWEKR